MPQIDWSKWTEHLKSDRIHIILEGGDNAGKSTLARSLNATIGHSIKCPIVDFSNPFDTELYRSIKENNYSAFTIGMMTMTEQENISKTIEMCSFFDHAIIIQDRHACISGYAYNVPYMDKSEIDTYLYCRDNLFGADLQKSIVVIIDTDRVTDGQDKFETNEIQATARLRYKHSFVWSGAKIIRVHNYYDDVFVNVRDEILERITEQL